MTDQALPMPAGITAPRPASPLLTGPILPTLLRLSIPNTLTMTATALEESPDVTGTVDGTLLDLERKGGGGTLHYMLRGDSTSNALSGVFEGAHDPMAATDFLARRVSRQAAR